MTRLRKRKASIYTDREFEKRPKLFHPESSKKLEYTSHEFI